MQERKLMELAEAAGTIAIVGHVRPDGDCVGSCLAVCNYITEQYPEKTVDVYLETPPVKFSYLKQFERICSDPETGKQRLSWDLKPAYWTKEPDLLNIDRFLETDLMKSGPVAETYQKVCDGLDGILAKHGYHREGRLYRTKQHNEDTIVLFCHMGVTFYMLSHLLSISPVCLNHTMFLPPSSVTVVSTEEVEQGYGMFRTQMLGDTSHLYCAGEPVSHMGYFAEILQERPL